MPTSANATKLANLVNPEVMGDMIAAGLPKAIKFTQICKIDNTLEGRPGSTITIPAFKYIGDAQDVAEGAAIDVSKLEASTAKVSVKKVGKAAEITDEAALSGYGDPVGETQRQLLMSIASKVDEDIVTALGTTTLTVTDTNEISYEGIVNGVDKFAEESDVSKVLFIHPEQLSKIRKDPAFIDRTKYGGDLMMTGAIGSICGCEVVVSRRVPKAGGNFTNFMVQMSAAETDGQPVMPAVTIYVKKAADVETDRDILAKTTVISAAEHYAVGLTNPAKVLKMTFKAV